ncbi:MAG: YwiC-like family protein [Micrococcales bacterium]|nr:YwiC-like family protein [Micrococcales bacterium]
MAVARTSRGPERVQTSARPAAARPATAQARAERPHPKKKRRSPGWVPNQHGAWAMLAAPLLVGIAMGGPAWVHLPLTAFWFVGYFAFYATGLWLKSRRKARYLPPVRAYALAAAPLGLLTAAMRPDLVRWAPLFVLPMGVGLAAYHLRKERSLLSGLATTAGSTLMTPVAYAAGGGSVDRHVWLVTAVLAAYFVGTVLYVKTMIREHDSAVHYWLSVGFHCAATVAMLLATPLLVLVFAALAVRAAVLPAFEATPKAVGIGEIAATVAVMAGVLAW